METNDDETRGRKSLKEEIGPESLTDLYMDNRKQMLECNSEYIYYRHLIESINIGYAILGDNNSVGEKIKKALNDAENYPKSRNMDYKSSSHVYTCSTGDDVTGKVTVRPEELELGEMSLRNQQANAIVQRLTPIDRMIFLELIKNGWIKKLTMKETIEKDIITELMEELDEQ